MATIRTLSDEALRKLQWMEREIKALRREVTGRKVRRGGSYPVFIRTGKAYASIPAGTDDEPGVGEWIPDNIELGAPDYTDEETADPQPIYNLSQTAIDNGQRIAAGLHLSSRRGTNGEPCWVVVGNEVADAPKLLALCKTSNQAIVTDVATKLTFQHSHNFSTANHTPFDAGAAFDGIELKKVGWYLLEYDLSWQGEPTSTGAGTDLQAKEGNITIGTSTNGIGSVTTADCSMMLATVAKLADSDQSIAVGGCGARTVLFRNTAITNVAHVMITTCTGHTFAADCCEFRARYLHNLTSTETTP